MRYGSMSHKNTLIVLHSTNASPHVTKNITAAFVNHCQGDAHPRAISIPDHKPDKQL